MCGSLSRTLLAPVHCGSFSHWRLFAVHTTAVSPSGGSDGAGTAAYEVAKIASPGSMDLIVRQLAFFFRTAEALPILT